MEFIKALKNSISKQRRKTGTRAYYASGQIYMSRLFGFRLVEGRYEPDPRFVSAIETIFQMLAEGRTLVETKAALDEMGARDSSHNRFGLSRLVNIGERPVYCGYLLQRGRLVRINNLTPIVSLKVWQDAQRQLKAEKKKLV